jgi:hypothetical protein
MKMSCFNVTLVGIMVLFFTHKVTSFNKVLTYKLSHQPIFAICNMIFFNMGNNDIKCMRCLEYKHNDDA